MEARRQTAAAAAVAVAWACPHPHLTPPPSAPATAAAATTSLGRGPASAASIAAASTCAARTDAAHAAKSTGLAGRLALALAKGEEFLLVSHSHPCHARAPPAAPSSAAAKARGEGASPRTSGAVCAVIQ